MSEYILSCCSTVDLTKEHLEGRGIPFVCFHYNLDGKLYPDDFGATTSYEEFYSRIAAGAEPSTTQVNVDEFKRFFEPSLKAGKDILHISFSSGLSGTYNSARIACEELCEKYPERKLFVVDSLCASSGYGLFVEILADKRDAGATIEELLAFAEATKLNMHHWFFSTDLTSYIRGGRVSKAAGLFGSLLGICPLLNMDDTGHIIAREKVRTKKRVIARIVEKMKQHAKDGINYSGKCYICQSACYDDARAVADLVEETFPMLSGQVQIYSIGTVIGSHTGCGTVALFFVGDERTA